MGERSDARVLIVGLGGLGCPAALALARAGVGTLGLVDDDVVDETNLHRQILYTAADVGHAKVDVAARALCALRNFDVECVVYNTRFLPDNAVQLASGFDLVVEGSDNFATKFLAADACRAAVRPVVHGAAVRWHGSAFAVSACGRPCYRCLFEDIPEGETPNCEDAGVVGPVAGIVAAAQVDFALGILSGRDPFGQVFTFDGKSLAVRRHRVEPRPSCRLCGAEGPYDSSRAA